MNDAFKLPLFAGLPPGYVKTAEEIERERRARDINKMLNTQHIQNQMVQVLPNPPVDTTAQQEVIAQFERRAFAIVLHEQLRPSLA